MRHCGILSLRLTWLLILVVAACGGPVPATAVPQPTAAVPRATEPPDEATPAPEATVDPEFALEDIATAEFDRPTEINNKYFPLTPGTEFTYDGFTREGANQIPHSLIFTVTELTKEVEGINSVVAYILDYSDGQLVEAEIAFYAQDNDGNVWFMGEYPEVYEYGQIVEAPAWIPGFKGARAGIVMKAAPRPGTPSYAQGWGPAVGWNDRGRVVAVGQATCVPLDCYRDVLLTEEFSHSQPGAAQVKYYAPEVGNIKVTWKGDDASREVLELTSLKQLSPEEMAAVGAAALELEQSAIENSREVYAPSSPLVYAPDPAAVANFWEVDAASFSNPTDITNPWMPMQPGSHWVYEGTAVDEEGKSFTRRIEFTVTGLTKEIGGVDTLVAWIVDYNDGDIVEKEIAFYAQDDAGNIWYFGEYPEEYEEGEFVKASPWIHGIADAMAGIKMVAEPAAEMTPYFQGWGPAVEWSDYGQVAELGAETCVPVDCYEGVLVIAESSLGEVDAYQLKYYAPNVGEVRVGWDGEDAAREELELIELEQLSAEQLGEINELVLDMEARAYERADEVYGKTSPAR